MADNMHDPEVEALLRSVNGALAGTSLNPPAALKAGQVWRARWDDVLALVFVDAILEGGRNLLRVAPVSIGTDTADDTAIIIPKEANPLEVALSVWPELVTEIAEVVLERWVTALEPFESLNALESAVAAGVFRRGAPVLNDLSPRAPERRLLELAMEVLSLAADVPTGEGKMNVALAGIAASKVAATLDVDSRAGLQILRGERFIDWEQALALASAFDRDPNVIFHANPAAPPEFLAAITALRRSAEIRTLAERRHVAESTAFADAVRGTFALAARNEGAKRDWAGRVARYFELALAE